MGGSFPGNDMDRDRAYCDGATASGICAGLAPRFRLCLLFFGFYSRIKVEVLEPWQLLGKGWFITELFDESSLCRVALKTEGGAGRVGGHSLLVSSSLKLLERGI